MSWKENLKLITKTAFIVSSRLIFFVGIGVVINWLFIAITAFSLFNTLVQDVGVAARTGIGAVIALLPFLIVIAIFFAGFPFVYFLIVKSYAIKKGIKHIFEAKCDALFSYFVPKFVEFTAKRYSSVETNYNETDFSKKVLTKMDNMPKYMKLIYTFLLAKIPFLPTFQKITSDIEIKEENYDLISTRLTEELSENIKEEILGTSLKFYFIVMLINFIAMFALIKIVLI